MSEELWTSVFHMVVDAAISTAQLIFTAAGAAVHYFVFVAIFSALFVGVIRRFISNSSFNYGTELNFKAKRSIEKGWNKAHGKDV